MHRLLPRAAIVITSAQEATRSVWCAAESCGNEAESGSRLCWRCAKRDSVRLHTTPPRLPDTLPCCICTKELPDDDFSKKSDATHRRYRHHECKKCAKARRDHARRDPAVRAREAAAQRARRLEQRQLLRQLRESLQ